ncbi:hypothetical protein MLD38_013481 [Melastoma candidum]|uniref:Uncharacterized protein n=1 Tax=Melastoma candidum TaxID=119954 RepID=A0ACB9RDW5_9MYRT|nr:hypothetical protein MLD38_013481 [Melastoma candidum]
MESRSAQAIEQNRGQNRMAGESSRGDSSLFASNLSRKFDAYGNGRITSFKYNRPFLVHRMAPFLLCLIVFILSACLLRAFSVRSSASSGSLKQPPSPPSLPIIGHIHLLGSVLPKSFQTLARRYGPLMQIRIGGSNFWVASDAAVAKEILQMNDVNFASRFELGPVQYSIYRGVEFVTAPYNPYYRFMKKLCLTKLFAASQYERFRRSRGEEIERLVRSLVSLSMEGKACNLSTELGLLMNRLIFKMIMSKRYSKFTESVATIQSSVKVMLELGAKLGVYEVFGPLKCYDLFGHGKKLTAAMLRYDGLVEEIMKDYENGEQGVESGDESGRDLMELLLAASRDDAADILLTRRHIKNFFLEMLFASTDTSTAALQWAMTELINNPAILEKLREEIKSVVPEGPIKESDIPNLPYLQSVVKETLRLHTPTPLLFRECSRECQVGEYQVKAGTRFFINLYAIMRDPSAWTDEEEFVPERFLMKDSTLLEFQYFPFGGGRRVCIGMAFANMVMALAIGTLAQCFDWELKSGEKIDVKVGSGFSGAMARPLLCHPITRYDPFK